MKASWNGAVIAESEQTIVLEGNHYFPPDSVATEYLSASTRQYTCPWKGEAKYWDIAVGGAINENAAWSYPNPKPEASEIAEHFAFERSKGINVER